MLEFGGLLAVILLVAANGFFVAAEFSLVAVRRSRVVELVAAGKMNAKALERALEHLDSNLAATQLGITISSLALGWIGEPAIAHLIEPVLAGSVGSIAGISADAINANESVSADEIDREFKAVGFSDSLQLNFQCALAIRFRKWEV